MIIYKFKNLSKKLDQLGFPKTDKQNNFQVIKGVDFEKAYKAGTISFEDDGIYLEYEREKFKGYMFIENYYVSYNGAPEKFPKFHIAKCEVIQRFIDSGRFNQRYVWSNSNVNDIRDKQSRNLYSECNLELCSKCRFEMMAAINTTEEFYESLDKSNFQEEAIEVDIFGYVRGKEQISKRYRSSVDYTCEICGRKAKQPLHKRWWHTHHIDGDKLNNNFSNLKCLCIKCHSQVDDNHQKNFSIDRMMKELELFKNFYS
ncbi:MAG: hypothetical protein CMC13_06670 [Flavobacteriaceae bacterium]|nr:hypothetical protein [Flavobacteriaceae bacterium]